MGGWYIYCAICGGPFSSQVEMDPEGTEEDSYRYDVLKDCDLGWLDNLCALGFNPDAGGIDKSFLSGNGYYWDYGGIEVSSGGDPNLPLGRDTDQIPMAAYHDFAEIGEPHVFPFHTICYHDILQRSLKQGSPGKNIRGDVLFNVLEGLNGGRYVRLQLSYGEPEPPAEQVWHQQKGHEILVVNPVTIPQIDADLDFIKQSLSQKRRPSQPPQREDIFDKLSHELRHEIFKLLPAASILALKAASWPMHITTFSRDLWRARLTSEVPWLWEIHDIDVFCSQESENKASKLLLDIQKKSAYTSENDDYILGIANRRRIWGVCDQIRARYLEGFACISDPGS